MTSVLHRQTLASPMSEFLGSATIISILWYGGKLVLEDNSPLKPEEFLTYIYAFLYGSKSCKSNYNGILQHSKR